MAEPGDGEAGNKRAQGWQPAGEGEPEPAHRGAEAVPRRGGGDPDQEAEREQRIAETAQGVGEQHQRVAAWADAEQQKSYFADNPDCQPNAHNPARPTQVG